MPLRPATHADLEPILAIARACPTAPHWPESAYRAILDPASAIPRCLFLALTPAGDPAGYAAASPVELEVIAVHPNLRNRGHGEALLRAVIAWARQQGSCELNLEVRASSAGPVRLYHRLGFIETGRRPRYYQHPEEDALLLRAAL